MKRLKIIICIILVVILIIGIAILLLYNNRLYSEQNTFNQEVIEKEEKKPIIQRVSIRSDYYLVKTCLTKYYEYLSEVNAEKDQIEFLETDLETYKLNLSKILYTMLNEEYINEYMITENNIIEKIPNNGKCVILSINSMYVSQQSDSLHVYFVNVSLRNIKTSVVQKYDVMITLDRLNNTFNIAPGEYIKQKYGTISTGQEFKIENINEVTNNKYNIFEYKSIDDLTIVKDYFKDYQNKAIYDVEVAYDMLDKEYRENKFGSIENYKQYVKENIKKIIVASLDKYQKTVKDGYTQYVCIDTNGNYFIFRETAVMQYKLLLDTYTIDIPEFTEKYNKSDNETKVGMNIEKILSALNNKDYSYIYSKLASSFQNNYFPTEESLKQYLKTNLYEKNTVEYKSVDNEGENYMFDIQFKDATDETKAGVSKRIIMQLKEGTDFVFSFNVN